jgi:excisionase family DNA binding protein
MAQEYYTLERAAEVLKLSTGEVKRMQEQGQLRAFRDGSNWKFRKEDVEESLANLIKKRNQQAETEEEEVLTFGLVEEGEELPTLMAESDLSDTDDGLSLADEDSDLGLGLDIEETVPHDTISLANPEPQFEEGDDLVLGESNDLDISSAGGFSIDASEDDVALELDEESDILALVDSDGDSEIPTLLTDGGTGNEFDLIADTDDFEDSESSSQVIALDDTSFNDEMSIGGDEMPDFGSSAFESVDSGFGSATSSGVPISSAAATQFTSASSKTPPGRSPFEASYSGKAVTALGLLCVVPVGLAGFIVFDLVRFMGSWDQTAPIRSPIIEMVVKMLGLG